MSKKFHIGKNGPALCEAVKQKCPIGGEHGSETEILQIWHEKMDAEFGETSTISKRIPGVRNIALEQSIIEPSETGKYLIDTGEYVGFSQNIVNYDSVDVLKDIADKHDKSISASDVDGKKLYIETNPITSEKSFLINQEIFDELSDQGLEFTIDEPTLLTINKNTELSNTSNISKLIEFN